MRTLVIMPAFNEQAALGATLGGLRDSHGDLDVLVVDDGSVDETAAVAHAAGADVLRLPYNLGIGGALRTGFKWAVRNGYDRAIQFDADGQHDPASIAVLQSALDSGADLVIGSRFADDEQSGYTVSHARGGAMRLLRLLVRLLTGRRFSDTSSGCRGFSRALLEFFAVNYPVEYMESVEALVIACDAGFDVREVPVMMHERQAGEASTQRLRLAYHFLRVLVVTIASKGALQAPARSSPAMPDETSPAVVTEGGGPR